MYAKIIVKYKIDADCVTYIIFFEKNIRFSNMVQEEEPQRCQVVEVYLHKYDSTFLLAEKK